MLPTYIANRTFDSMIAAARQPAHGADRRAIREAVRPTNRQVNPASNAWGMAMEYSRTPPIQ
jgi:hypothetical protein